MVHTLYWSVVLKTEPSQELVTSGVVDVSFSVAGLSLRHAHIWEGYRVKPLFFYLEKSQLR